MQTSRNPSTSCITVDGASLSYETIGTGPLFIPIPGANGTGVIYQPLATALSSHFQVALYDRRGFGNSFMVPHREPDTTTHLRMQADDVARLIQHLSPGKPATVFAASGSGAMAIELLQSRPDLVGQLILHEPLLTALFPPPFRSYINQTITHTALKSVGRGNAILRRMLLAFVQGQRDQQRLSRDPHYALLKSRPADETALFFTFELRLILDYHFDLENLRPYRDKFVLMKGMDISPELASYPVISLSGALGISMTFAPGGHNGFVTDAEKFAKKVITSLERQKANL